MGLVRDGLRRRVADQGADFFTGSSVEYERDLRRMAGSQPVVILTTKASDFEARLVALIADLVSEETSAGRLTAAVPVDDLPYVLVRIMESYIYLGLITGEHPDPDRAARVINALLPG